MTICDMPMGIYYTYVDYNYAHILISKEIYEYRYLKQRRFKTGTPLRTFDNMIASQHKE